MNRYRILFLFILICINAAFSQKKISIDDCFSAFRFYPEQADALRFDPDGKHYLEKTGDGLERIDIVSGKSDETLVPKAALKTIGDWDYFEFTQDMSVFLFRTDSKPVYRHSVLAKYWVYRRADNSMTAVSDRADLQFAKLSPDGQKVAYVLGNNLYYKDLSSGELKQVTRDGRKNEVINGLPDWLYEEEFSPVDGDGMVATQWSPDGARLAYIRFDERKVPEFTMNWYNNDAYPEQSSFKYPKVGETNASVEVRLYDTRDPEAGGAVMGLEADDYVPRIYFTRDNQLVVFRLNRMQDTLELLIAMPERPIYDEEENRTWLPSRLLLRETDPAYVDIHDNLYFLEDKRRFIWTSEKDGYNHIYLHYVDRNAAALPVQLTKGNFDVTAFYGVDEKNGKFYYQTATPTPMDRQLWEGSLSGAAPRLLSAPAGTAEAGFSPSFDYFLRSWSDADTPPQEVFCNRQGEPIRTLVDNKTVARRRADYGFVQKTFWQFPLADGTLLNGWMLRPDSLEPGRRYPVLFDVYGGPGSQTVQNQYDGYMDPWRQMLVQKGVIVVSVDNRGTGARGAKFKKCTQLQLGKLETEDQIAAARYLGTLPYIDPARIGIWGWSFGGYLSTSCILKGNDVFRMAMAVAPVTNWKWYDSAYTERFMHTLKDNAAGYNDNSPIYFADRLRGGNYLICHGIADDNVHFQQSTEMINALIAAGKQFETAYYPNRNHGIYGDNATRHLFTRLTRFVEEQLLSVE